MERFSKIKFLRSLYRKKIFSLIWQCKAFQMNYSEPVIGMRILEKYLQRDETFAKISSVSPATLTQNKLLNINFPRTLTTTTEELKCKTNFFQNT